MLCVFVAWMGLALAHADEPPALQYAQVTVERDGEKATLDLCLFDAEVYQLRVMDNINRMGMHRVERLSYAMSYGQYVAGVNGGFFEVQEFEPCGLQISNGQRTGAFDRERWFTGVVQVKDGQLALLHRDNFEDSDAITQLIQTGPWLVRDNATPKEGLGDHRTAARTFICQGKDGRWAIGVCDKALLRDLAAMLQSPEIQEYIEVENALNLDGGPSTGFWMRGKANIQEQWPVRNYLGLYRK